jgi:uncharacterized membrane protein
MIIDKWINRDPSVKRHIAKTISWRMIGTIDTMLLGWYISGNPLMGLKIGGLELMTKMTLYYIHERVWFKSRFGLPKKQEQENKEVQLAAVVQTNEQ